MQKDTNELRHEGIIEKYFSMYLKTKDETKKMPGCKSGCPQSQSKDNKEDKFTN